MSNPIYTRVTASILAQLEAGTAPWVRPWSRLPARAGMPCNAISNRGYSGCNVVLLWLARDAGYPLPRYLTYKQALAAGGHVRKGEKGETVFFVKRSTFKDKATDEERTATILRAYTVFNVSQCDGLPDRIALGPDAPRIISNEGRMAECDAFLRATKARISANGDAAYYRPSTDEIVMPPFAAFDPAQGFYATAFHELTHWTGHKSRCDRDFSQSKRFGDHAYAAEELVAELGAAFLCAEFGIDATMRHASYIASWIKCLKDDPRAFFTAASKAQQAVDHLRALALGDTATSDETDEAEATALAA